MVSLNNNSQVNRQIQQAQNQAARPQVLGQRAAATQPAILPPQVKKSQDLEKADKLFQESSFRGATQGEEDHFSICSLQLADKSSVLGKLRQARKEVLGDFNRRHPGISQAMDGESSGRVGKQAGYTDLPNGGGLLGALSRKAAMHKQDRFTISERELRSRSNEAGGQLHEARAATLQSRSLSGKPERHLRLQERAGQRKLNLLLSKASGKVGEFLGQSPIRKQLDLVSEMQQALGSRESLRLRHEHLHRS